jgi:hypothetical protein
LAGGRVYGAIQEKPGREAGFFLGVHCRPILSERNIAGGSLAAVDTGLHGRRPGIEILAAISMKFRCGFSSGLLLMLGNCVLGGRAYLCDGNSGHRMNRQLPVNGAGMAVWQAGGQVLMMSCRNRKQLLIRPCKD